MINIKIEKFNNLKNFELPENNMNLIIGNNFNLKSDIINSLQTYFSSAREDSQYIEYNGGNLKIFNKKNELISKKEYKIISLDIVKIDMVGELSLSKSSYFRELMNIYLSQFCNGTEEEFLINSIISDIAYNINQKITKINSFLPDSININVSASEINNRIFLDSILNIHITKNEANIPISFLSFNERVLLTISIIKQLISKIGVDQKILFIIDGIDYKLTTKEKEQVYEIIKSFDNYKNVQVYIFTNEIELLSLDNNLYKSVIVNINNSIIYLDDYDYMLDNVIKNYPIFIPEEEINNKVKATIIKYFNYLHDFSNLSDKFITQLDELTIIKILLDSFDFKYDMKLVNEYLNNRFYSYLIS